MGGLRRWLFEGTPGTTAEAEPPVDFETVLEAERKSLRSFGDRDGAPIGLALSGGGIRSATLALGLLQSLARAGTLASFDYLSTVSGGGYIGSWLSAWAHRSGLASVQEQLAQSATGPCHDALAREPDEVGWLRNYSNYLTPRLGILSLDSLTLFAIWLRNFLLNLVVYVAFVAAVLLIPHLLLPLARMGVDSEMTGYFATLLAIGTFIVIGYNLTATRRRELARRHPGTDARLVARWEWLTTPRGVACTVVTPAWLG